MYPTGPRLDCRRYREGERGVEDELDALAADGGLTGGR